MICIADSGSTKTTWVVVDDNGVEHDRTTTVGLNPFFVDSNEVAQVFSEAYSALEKPHVTAIYFYGAGCSSDTRRAIVSEGMKQVLNPRILEINHDLLAAARATCKDHSGVSCILGTGSNSCEYDGQKITDNVPALGFLAGDEGSGSAIGRRLIQGWLYREMPNTLVEKLTQSFDLTKEKTLHQLYYEPKPNRFMASLSMFCSQHRQHGYIQQIITDSFDEFIDRHVLKYGTAGRVPIHFVGSIAHHFNVELKDCLNRKDLELGLVIKEPINELVKFHAKG